MNLGAFFIGLVMGAFTLTGYACVKVDAEAESALG